MKSLKTFERTFQFVFLLLVTFGIHRYIGDEAAKMFLLALIAINLISIKLAIYDFIGRTPAP